MSDEAEQAGATPAAAASPPPEVSVVIPTRRRPRLLLRALRTVLAQTVSRVECIVVVDGPDPATLEAVATIPDARIRTLTMPTRSGASAARNAGVVAARAQWIAFLDDDDEWHPTKLDRQRAVALASALRWPIVSCQLNFSTAGSRDVLPRQVPVPNDFAGPGSLSEYLFRRRSLFGGEGAVLTSSLFIPRELLRRVRFDDELEQFQDADWLLRAQARDGVGLLVVPEPLGIWHGDELRKRLSDSGSWEHSLGWIRKSLAAGLVTRESFASFVMTICAAQASHARDTRAAWVLLREAFVIGKPHPTLFIVFLAQWLVPRGVRRMIRRFFMRRKARQSRGANPGRSKQAVSSASP